MQYYCEIVEKSYGHVIVEAESWDEARRKAREIYDDGDTTWGQIVVDIDVEEEES